MNENADRAGPDDGRKSGPARPGSTLDRRMAYVGVTAFDAADCGPVPREFTAATRNV
jgi:hypothetical protein